MSTGVEIFYVKDITDKKVACQNQEVEGHIAGYLLQRKPQNQEVEGHIAGNRLQRKPLTSPNKNECWFMYP
jgi:hypothetical protein